MIDKISPLDTDTGATIARSRLVPGNLLKDVSSGEILSIIKEHGGEYLESASIFDVYEGEHIEAGYRSLAYNLQFRSMEGTLNDEDIDGNIQAIIDALAEINCKLR